MARGRPPLLCFEENVMKKLNSQAVKSMTQLAVYLILMIVIWVFIAKLVFPNDTKTDVYQTFIDAHAPLMEQVAQNAMDESVWSHIQSTAEVQDMLKEGGIVSVTGDEESASFWLQDENPEATLRYAYFPLGAYIPPEVVRGSGWVEEKVDAEGVTRYVGGLAGQGSVSARRLSERFFLEEALIP